MNGSAAICNEETNYTRAAVFTTVFFVSFGFHKIWTHQFAQNGFSVSCNYNGSVSVDFGLGFINFYFKMCAKFLLLRVNDVLYGFSEISN